jgi:hypothetical protein
MKINENFLLRDIAGQKVVLPVGEAAEKFNGMIRLNDTGIYLWTLLEQDTDEDALLSAMLRDYEIDEETARADIHRFVETLRKAGILVE